MPDEGAPFVLERVVQVMGDDFVQLAALEVGYDFGFVLPHDPEFVGVDDLVTAFVEVELALTHLQLALDLQAWAVVGKEDPIT